MNTRSLLIIAAVPGFRANTKLEREDNNAPRVKVQPLDIYADLVLGRPRYEVEERRKVKLTDLPKTSRVAREFEAWSKRKEEERTQELEAQIARYKAQPKPLSQQIKESVFFRGRPSLLEQQLPRPPVRVSDLDRVEKKLRFAQLYANEDVAQLFQPKARPRSADKL